jgi:hypothetical protein
VQVATSPVRPFRHNPAVNFGRAARPASIALAVGASGLLIAGLVVPGFLVGLLAVGAAWLRSSAPPSD